MIAPENWVWLVLVAVGGWAASQFWPWLRGVFDVEFKARRQREQEDVKEQRERNRKVLEDRTAAEAQRETRFVAAFESLAISNRQIADTLIAMQFETAATSREVRELRADLARSGMIERRSTRRKIQAPKREDV